MAAQKCLAETLYLSAEGIEAKGEGASARSHCGLKVRVLAMWPTIYFDLMQCLSSSDNTASDKEVRAPGQREARRSTQQTPKLLGALGSAGVLSPGS